jgi:hypothetical protein
MTNYFVGPGGSDAANGTTYALRKLTLTAAEALSLVAGDDVIAAPGVYAESLTYAKSGGNVYTTGTVSLTNGSKVVTGSGTTWSTNLFVNGVFQIRTFVSGADGVTTGTDNTFTSAAGNFQAGMVGYVLSVMTKGAYRILAVSSAASITLENTDGSSAAPTSGTGLTYSIAQPESPYDIASVDSNTQITLAKPWAGPSLTGIPYRAWRPIRFIADLTGYLTDGVGGPVVLSASGDQATQTRTTCLSVNTRTQRTIRGFSFQLGTSTIDMSSGSDNIFEDFFVQGGASNSAVLNITGLGTGNTFRRGIVQIGRGNALTSFNATAQDNANNLFENLLIIGGAAVAMSLGRYGNSLVRNCTVIGSGNGIQASTASPTTGQAVIVNNCLFLGCGLSGVSGAPTWFFEDYNAIFGAASSYSNVTTGVHSLTTNSPMLDLPLLTGNGYREDWNPWDLQSITGLTSPLRNKASAPYPGDDLYGVERPQGTLPNWGPIEAPARPQRETVIVRNGTSALKLASRGRHAMLVPVTFGQAITITAYSRHDTDASIGLRPRARLLADYGIAEQSAVSGGDGTTWSTLTIGPITPVAPATGNTDGGMMVLLLENRCTNSTSIAAYFDDVTVA